jgi:hypothetical protein
VYADLWLQKSAPLEAINHALEETLDDVTVPGSKVGRPLSTIRYLRSTCWANRWSS